MTFAATPAGSCAARSEVGVDRQRCRRGSFADVRDIAATGGVDAIGSAGANAVLPGGRERVEPGALQIRGTDVRVGRDDNPRWGARNSSTAGAELIAWTIRQNDAANAPWTRSVPATLVSGGVLIANDGRSGRPGVRPSRVDEPIARILGVAGWSRR